MSWIKIVDRLVFKRTTLNSDSQASLGKYIMILFNLYKNILAVSVHFIFSVSFELSRTLGFHLINFKWILKRRKKEKKIFFMENEMFAFYLLNKYIF